MLVVSWENGRLSVYTIDNLDYTIQNTLAAERKAEDEDDKVFKIDLNKNKIFSEKASSEVKYRLEIYCIRKGKCGSQSMAFQLQNNEVVMIDTTHRRFSHFRGVSQNNKVFAVLEMDDYIGVAHSEGIDLYSSDRF